MTTFAYLSPSLFLRCPPLKPEHRFGIAGLPWDGSVTNRPGARFGPRAIREASTMLCEGTHPHFDCVLDGLLGDAGDLALPNTGLAEMRRVLETQAEPLLRQHHMAWLGGDHALTLSLLRVYRRVWGRPLGVLHFDAHCDTWPDHFGEPSGHGTWVYEAVKEGLVDARGVVQIGIRSPAERSAREFVADQGGLIFTGRALRGLASAQQLAPVLGAIRQRYAELGDLPVYLSLDIDVLDPADAPGTGTPEPGGLSSSQMLTLLEELAPIPFIGMDCVELSPPYDQAERSALAAAVLVWTQLCGQAARHPLPPAA